MLKLSGAVRFINNWEERSICDKAGRPFDFIISCKALSHFDMIIVYSHIECDVYQRDFKNDYSALYQLCFLVDAFEYR